MNNPKPQAKIDRRRFLSGAVQAASLLALAGCDNLSRSDWFPSLLSNTEKLTRKAQRVLSPRKAMAREYTEADRSAVFPANGNSNPEDADYQAMVKNGFADWKLEIGGLVEKPASFSLAQLRQMPSRTQTTRHDCVEGWSAIATWTGVKLGDLLERVRPKPEARFIVFYCADPDEDGEKYYESVDFDEAYHPQTILAYEMNGQALPVPHGAPIRLRIERQLGYKQAKYVMQIELVESLSDIAGGNGGYWEDQGYEWYAGI
jgi:DMSO/TMAO reductase YedYZ molybdopterin-dependent catalytic subunit